MEIEFDNEKYNTISINLFKLLKNHEYDKFKKVIIENKNILENIINIRDETNTYLLTYAILYNQFDIIKLLIDNGARIDILDSDEKSILYIPIKYNYDVIAEYLIDINNNNLGINILDIRDRNNNTSINYALENKNLKIIKKIFFL